jgi:hypothetical protein
MILREFLKDLNDEDNPILGNSTVGLTNVTNKAEPDNKIINVS